jgi:hypothetical protein
MKENKFNGNKINAPPNSIIKNECHIVSPKNEFFPLIIKPYTGRLTKDKSPLYELPLEMRHTTKDKEI